MPSLNDLWQQWVKWRGLDQPVDENEVLAGDASAGAPNLAMVLPKTLGRLPKIVKPIKNATIYGSHKSSNLESLANGFTQRDLGISVARTPAEELSSPTLTDRLGTRGRVSVKVKGQGLNYERPSTKSYIDSLIDYFIDNPEAREGLGADTATIRYLRNKGIDWVNGWNGIGSSPELHVINSNKIKILR